MGNGQYGDLDFGITMVYAYPSQSVEKKGGVVGSLGAWDELNALGALGSLGALGALVD